ncbi:MAG: hypothetical protein F6K61_06470 [Sphaerospermopsis sp. SIO1G1]|nr:hypothetical protein [Sphaerospermopsis sp. SIO1G1]
MNKRLSITFISASLLALASTLTFSQPSYAGGTKFKCQVLNGVHHTFAYTEDGKRYAIMKYLSTEFPPPYTPKRRCIDISKRFQRRYDNGLLRKVSSGTVNNQTVICAGRNENTVCNNNNILFTLGKGANAKKVANKLFNRRALATGQIVTNNSDPNYIMFDFDIYLNSLESE